MRRLRNRRFIWAICLINLTLLTGCSSDDNESGSDSIETISSEIIGETISDTERFVVDMTINVTYPTETTEIQNFSKDLLVWEIEGKKARLTYNKGTSPVERAYLMVDAPTSTEDMGSFTKAIVSANDKTYNLYVQIIHSNTLIENNNSSPILINISN